MKKKRIAYRKCIIAILLIATVALTGCGKQSFTNVKEEDKMKGELSVYYVDYAEQTSGFDDYTYELTLLLDNLKNEYPNIEIIPTTFGSNEAFMTQVATELSAGKGPDLFLMDYASKLDWNKMSKSGQYENLSPYMKNDKSYNSEDYFDAVIKAGQIDGKQYIMPITFNCVSLYTTNENLKSGNVDFINDYTGILSAFNKGVENANSADQIIPLALSLNRMDLLSFFMEAFGMPFVNYKTAASALDKQSLLELCDFLKLYYPYAESAFANKFENSHKTQNANQVTFTISNMGYIGENATQSIMAEQLDKKLITNVMPKYDNPNEAVGQIYYFSAVNGNSKNKQLAYDAAKALMDLKASNLQNISFTFPVNKKLLNDYMTDLKDEECRTPIDGALVSGEIDADAIEKIAASIKYVSLNSITTASIVNSGMMPYIEGTRDFDDCYDETVNKLNLYINE